MRVELEYVVSLRRLRRRSGAGLRKQDVQLLLRTQLSNCYVAATRSKKRCRMQNKATGTASDPSNTFQSGRSPSLLH